MAAAPGSSDTLGLLLASLQASGLNQEQVLAKLQAAAGSAKSQQGGNGQFSAAPAPSLNGNGVYSAPRPQQGYQGQAQGIPQANATGTPGGGAEGAAPGSGGALAMFAGGLQLTAETRGVLAQVIAEKRRRQSQGGTPRQTPAQVQQAAQRQQAAMAAVSSAPPPAPAPAPAQSAPPRGASPMPHQRPASPAPAAVPQWQPPPQQPPPRQQQQPSASVAAESLLEKYNEGLRDEGMRALLEQERALEAELFGIDAQTMQKLPPDIARQISNRAAAVAAADVAAGVVGKGPGARGGGGGQPRGQPARGLEPARAPDTEARTLQKDSSGAGRDMHLASDLLSGYAQQEQHPHGHPQQHQLPPQQGLHAEGSAGRMVPPSEAEEFYQRQLQWRKRTDLFSDRMREMIQEHELQECTFSPAINQGLPESSSSLVLSPGSQGLQGVPESVRDNHPAMSSAGARAAHGRVRAGDRLYAIAAERTNRLKARQEQKKQREEDMIRSASIHRNQPPSARRARSASRERASSPVPNISSFTKPYPHRAGSGSVRAPKYTGMEECTFQPKTISRSRGPEVIRREADNWKDLDDMGYTGGGRERGRSPSPFNSGNSGGSLGGGGGRGGGGAGGRGGRAASPSGSAGGRGRSRPSSAPPARPGGAREGGGGSGFNTPGASRGSGQGSWGAGSSTPSGAWVPTGYRQPLSPPQQTVFGQVPPYDDHSPEARPVWSDDFLRRQQAHVDRVQAKLRAKSEALSATTSPEANKTSRKMMEGLQVPTLMQRLASKSLRRSDGDVAGLRPSGEQDRVVDRDCTFHPEINRKSARMKPRSVEELSTGDRLRKEMTQASLRMEEEVRRSSEAPHRPHLVAKNPGVPGRLQLGAQLDTYLTWVDVSTKLRQERYQEEAIRRQGEEMAECTFQPRTIDAPAYVKRIAASRRGTSSARKAQPAPGGKPRWN